MKKVQRSTMRWMVTCAVAMLGMVGIAACGDDDSKAKDEAAVLEGQVALSRATEQDVTKREFLIDGNANDGQSDQGQEGDPHTTQEVIDTFEQADMPLTVIVEAVDVDFLEYPEDTDVDRLTTLFDEYGLFRLAVTRSEGAIEELLLDAEGKPLEEEANGIYWDTVTVTGQQYWLAHKLYDNVAVMWVNTEKQTDERFDRLNGVLEQLPQE